jgi:hypothetical protein
MAVFVNRSLLQESITVTVNVLEAVTEYPVIVAVNYKLYVPIFELLFV